MAGRSRWLVGSSRIRQVEPRAWNRARPARVRSPGDSVPAGRSTTSAPIRNLASRVPGAHRAEPLATSPRRRPDLLVIREVRAAVLAAYHDDDLPSPARDHVALCRVDAPSYARIRSVSMYDVEHPAPSDNLPHIVIFRQKPSGRRLGI